MPGTRLFGTLISPIRVKFRVSFCKPYIAFFQCGTKFWNGNVRCLRISWCLGSTTGLIRTWVCPYYYISSLDVLDRMPCYLKHLRRMWFPLFISTYLYVPGGICRQHLSSRGCSLYINIVSLRYQSLLIPEDFCSLSSEINPGRYLNFSRHQTPRD